MRSNIALDDRQILPASEVDYYGTGDSGQNPLIGDRCYKSPFHIQEDVRRASFGKDPVAHEQSFKGPGAAGVLLRQHVRQQAYGFQVAACPALVRMSDRAAPG